MRHWIVALLIFIAPPAFAQSVATTSSAIVAVVNDEAITAYDLNARVNFVLSTTHINSTPEAIARLKPQILRAMIDEKLQMQEGRKNKIDLTDKEVEQAIAAIESQRSMPPGAIAAMMASNKIPEETFNQQIKAQLVWSKLLQRKVRAQIKMSDDEVAQMQKKLSTPVMKQEMKIAILQLPVDKPQREGEVQQAAEKIVLEARRGADFEEISRQLAGGAAKLTSFWVRPEELDPAIAKSLQGAKAGDVVNPLKSNLGYTIIKVYETRDLPGQEASGTEIDFREIHLKLRSSADKGQEGQLAEVAERVAKNPGKCEDKDIPADVDRGVASIEVVTSKQMLAELPAALRVVADGMKEGEVSSPLASEEGIHIYMLCGRKDGVNAPVSEDRARAALYQQRMELEAQKYMRNLRRDAFIDIRG